MSITIIVRKSGYHTRSRGVRFQPHFNRELCDKQHPHGQMIHTKEQYYGELKRRGLEPYDPKAMDCGKTKPIAMSEDTKGVIKAINEHTKNGKFKPSGKLLDKMASKGVNLRPSKSDMEKLAKKTGSISKGGIKSE